MKVRIPLLQMEKLRFREGKCLTKVTELEVAEPGSEPELWATFFIPPCALHFAHNVVILHGSLTLGLPDWLYLAKPSQPNGTPFLLHPSSLQL